MGLGLRNNEEEGMRLRKNSLGEIYRYFQGVGRHTLLPNEFLEFWHTLDEEEQEYYRRVDLKTSEIHKEL
jgi:hypothetical protein